MYFRLTLYYKALESFYFLDENRETNALMSSMKNWVTLSYFKYFFKKSKKRQMEYKDIAKISDTDENCLKTQGQRFNISQNLDSHIQTRAGAHTNTWATKCMKEKVDEGKFHPSKRKFEGNNCAIFSSQHSFDILRHSWCPMKCFYLSPVSFISHPLTLLVTDNRQNCDVKSFGQFDLCH